MVSERAGGNAADWDHVQKRSDMVRRVLLLEMLLNVAVAVAKGVVGTVLGNLTLVADAVHSAVDAVANVAGMVAIRFATKPANQSYPYGLYKVEIVAAAAIGVAIGITALELVWTAVQTLWEGRPPSIGSASAFGAGLLVIVITWIINVFVALWERYWARRLNSAYLAADAAHTASDVFVTAAVLVAFAANYWGIAWADPIGALVVIVVILRVAWHVLANNVSILLDRAAVDSERVRAVALSVEGVCDCHRIRSRGNENAAYLDLHLQMPGDLPLERAHALSHEVERALRQQMPQLTDIVIHIEPADDPPENL